MNLVAVLDAIKGGAITRDLLYQRWPRVNQDAIDRQVVVLRNNRFIDENDVGRLTPIVVIDPMIAAQRDRVLSELAVPPAEPPSPPVFQNQPRPAASPPARVQERTMTTKICSKCGESKPPSEFYANQARCKKCFLAVQKAGKERRAAAAGKVAPKSAPGRKPGRPKPETRSAKPAAKSNGSLFIPAGTEIRAEVLRDAGIVRFVEIASRDLSPGDAADRTWSAVKLDIYQLRRLHAFIGAVLSE